MEKDVFIYDATAMATVWMLRHSVQASSSPSGQTRTLELRNLSQVCYRGKTKAVTKCWLQSCLCPGSSHNSDSWVWVLPLRLEEACKLQVSMHAFATATGSYLRDIFFRSQKWKKIHGERKKMSVIYDMVAMVTVGVLRHSVQASSNPSVQTRNFDLRNLSQVCYIGTTKCLVTALVVSQ